jgi:IS605 OrfB family transposase
MSERWRNLNRNSARAVLEEFFGNTTAYLRLPTDKSESTEDAPASESAADIEFRNIARGWISRNFGTGLKNDSATIASRLEAIASMDLDLFVEENGGELAKAIARTLSAEASDEIDRTLDSIRAAIGWRTGRKSKGRLAIEKACKKDLVNKEDVDRLVSKLREEAKGNRQAAGQRAPDWVRQLRNEIEACIGFKYVLERDLIGEYSTMLDHAARRVSIAHSWIKLAEQRRRDFENDANKLSRMRSRARQAEEWLEQFCADRSTATGAGADSGYRIRRRATEGWSRVVKAWSRCSCITKEDRINAAREAQADPEIEKFGDIQLFEALAADEALCVWRDAAGHPDESILMDYVAGRTAEYNRTRFKVPAYRHPDPFRHPVFCDFGNSRWKIKFGCQRRHEPENHHNLRMGLWSGSQMIETPLRWSSKRLAADLAINNAVDPEAAEVTRADRIGRAASGAFGSVEIMNVFQEKHWNGRLQAPRAQLDRIANLRDRGNLLQAKKLRRRLRWLITFSPRLRPSGPFIRYAATHGIQPNSKGEYHPNAAVNAGRKGNATLLLSRLPQLRVLSVDLGHRFAAACAVWETVSKSTLQEETVGLKVLAGGSGHDALYLHVEKSSQDGRRRSVIYRRVGPDMLPDGTEHPAPWARLDRQFLIKLQGEERPTRTATPQETERVRGWETALGRVRNGEHDPLARPVDLLMSETVTMLRRALRRHGNRARIAFNLTATEKVTSGGGSEVLNREGRVQMLTETLMLWHGLFSGDHWADEWAEEEWNRRGLPELAMFDASGGGFGPTMRERRNKLAETLKPVAERLAECDLVEWSRVWTRRWEQDDAAWSGKDGILSRLKRWVAPRGLRPLPADSEGVRECKKAERDAARHVGGLSLTRISNISGVYQILKAFRMRPEPDDRRKNIPQKGNDESRNFNRRLLNTRDRLREQRVKQLASRIIEAALGIGRVHVPGEGKTPGRPRRAVDTPCHAVVIESLTHYRPDDLRTRRENRFLMQWSSGKVRQLLREGCQLNGLLLREVSPSYTSRQCSRTGLPGVRCRDVPRQEFLRDPWWRKTVKSGSARDLFLAELATELEDLESAQQPLPETVRVPQQGGALFVAAPPWKLLHRNQEANQGPIQSRALQADLNAAANIGLRALLDPDWPGRWWYVPCRADTSEPASDRIKGSAAFEGVKCLASNHGAGRQNSSREIGYLWRDSSASSVAARGEGDWKPTRPYWNDVEARAIRLLRRQAKLER